MSDQPSPATTPEPASSLRVDNGGTHDTTEDSFLPPGVTEQAVLLDAGEQIDVLTQFLEANFPGEMQRSNRQIPETAVETAMRLLLGLSSQAVPGSVTRCADSYCNQNANHAGPHRWIHRQ